jgi:hypothetical protein
MMTDPPERERAVWMARHENGWLTYVVESPDGTYAAWAAPEGATPTVDYVEMDPETAKTAALFALASKSGHTQCSAVCSGWELHTHTTHERES